MKPERRKNTETPLTQEERISLIERSLNITYSKEEMTSFDAWASQIPESSMEKPTNVTDINEIIDYLPDAPNYRGDKINLFFSKDEFFDDELQAVLENFARQNRSFEISIVRHNKSLISISIGDKLRNWGTIFEGEYLGHYHPTQFAVENEETLPKCFVAGLMPSRGDLLGYLTEPETIKNGTRIYSKNGYTVIRSIRDIENHNLALKEFAEKYFELFIGENKFNFQSDEEAVKYFKDNFGLQLEFHYFEGE